MARSISGRAAGRGARNGQASARFAQYRIVGDTRCGQVPARGWNPAAECGTAGFAIAVGALNGASEERGTRHGTEIGTGRERS
jgi:hypothetical protein